MLRKAHFLGLWREFDSVDDLFSNLEALKAGRHTAVNCRLKQRLPYRDLSCSLFEAPRTWTASPGPLFKAHNMAIFSTERCFLSNSGLDQTDPQQASITGSCIGLARSEEPAASEVSTYAGPATS